MIINLETWETRDIDTTTKNKLWSRVHTSLDPYPISYPEIYTELHDVLNISDDEIKHIMNAYVEPVCRIVSDSEIASNEMITWVSDISQKIVGVFDYASHPLLQKISTDIKHPYRHEIVFQTWIPNQEQVLQWFMFNFGVLYWDDVFQFVTPIHGHPASLLVDHAVPYADDQPLWVQIEYAIQNKKGKIIVDSAGEIIDKDIIKNMPNHQDLRLVSRDLYVFSHDSWLWTSVHSCLEWLCNPHSVLPLRKNYSTLNTYLWYWKVVWFHPDQAMMNLTIVQQTELERLLSFAPKTLCIDRSSPFKSLEHTVKFSHFQKERGNFI